MAKECKYVAREPDAEGFVEYPQEEHETWQILYQRQIEVIQNRACQEFLDGVDALGLSAHEIPQIPDMNKILGAATGWGVAPVAALISFGKFFELLANKKFPVATFIRTREELDYLQEPDIFHEIFGHCPLLTNQAYADFTETYGKLGLSASKKDRIFLARLYWFTIEFGLLNSDDGLRIYGGGILSSKEETIYALESNQPVREPLEVLNVLRTPYRIDVLQRIYFIINELNDLQKISKLDLIDMVNEARRLGLFESLYPPKEQVA